MINNLKDKVAVITGATGGIGQAMTKIMLMQNMHVIAVSQSKQKLEQLDDDMTDLPGKLTLFPGDLQKEETIITMLTSIKQRFDKIDVFISNAAVLGEMAPLHSIDSKTWNQVINTNLNSNFYIINNIQVLLEKADQPKIIFITSSAANTPKAYWGAYAVSKAALNMLAGIWMQELKQHKTQIYLYDPGATNTKMRDQAYPGEDKSILTTPSQQAEAILKLITSDKYYDNNKIISYKQIIK